MWKFSLLIGAFYLCTILNSANAQTKDRICTTGRFEDECAQLQRGNSDVLCIRVQDSIECAQRMMNGTADFGVFSAESALHVGTLAWPGLTVIKELRHRERQTHPQDYQSVVIVRSSHNGGLKGLEGLNFCHPGLQYDRSQRWSERFLKHFERTVAQVNCSIDGTSPAAMEAAALSRFFTSTCRPGVWSNNKQEDIELKEKHFNLCSLCDNPANCTYENTGSSYHRQALECLKRSGDAVTYVALQEAESYFDANPDMAGAYAYLCPSGSYQAIGTQNPCTWLTQPWKMIVARGERAISLNQRMQRWLTSTTPWEMAIKDILTAGSNVVTDVRNIVSVRDYIAPFREIPVPFELCSTTTKWCTKSYEEYQKCEVLRVAGLTSGILPLMVCNDPKFGAVSCLDDVSTGKADLVGIDSNFGFLARHPYNLTAAVYAEIDSDKYSQVVVLVKDGPKFNTFESLRGAKACFPEYGGIASIAFINTAKNRGMAERANCDFGPLLASIFDEACMPGSRDIFHDPSATNPDSLCSLCRVPITPQPIKPSSDLDENEDEYNHRLNPPLNLDDDIEGQENAVDAEPAPTQFLTNCAAEPDNKFYGTKGALSCLWENGDVAVLELQNLAEHANALNLDPNQFRVLCKNGSMAAYTGFAVDAECPLTIIVDGEVVTRRHTTKLPGIVNMLMSLDIYLQHDPDFKMYNIFNGDKNLLFEDSSLGIASPNNTILGESVQNYIKLFSDVENCFNGIDAMQINFLLTFTLVFLAVVLRF